MLDKGSLVSLKGKPLQVALAKLQGAGQAAKTATPVTVDFSKVTQPLDRPSGLNRDIEPTKYSPDGYSLKRQQAYRRVKRARDKLEKAALGTSVGEKTTRLRKPLDEWDMKELARGRPRNKQGKFSGPAPAWVSGEVHEEAMARFTSAIKAGMRAATPDAVKVITQILGDDSVDNRGKPVVPASTKLTAAQFLIEHVVGKPTQRVEQDISVKLQSILGVVMANPEDMATGFVPGHMPGLTMALAAAAGDDEIVVEEG